MQKKIQDKSFTLFFLMPIGIIFASRQIHFKFLWGRKASKSSQKNSEKGTSRGVQG